MQPIHKLPYLNAGHVELLPINTGEPFDIDLSVVNAARVSFAVQHDTFNPDKDIRLLNYLARNKHWTPFAHARLTLTFTSSYPGMSVPNILFDFLDRGMPPGFSVLRYVSSDRNSVVTRIEGSLYNWLSYTPIVPEAFHFLKQHAPHSVAAFQWPDSLENSALNNSFHMQFSRAYTFRIKAPIFVLRQLMRSNVGIVYNEVSRRYISTPPEFYIPAQLFARPEGNIKQGAGSPLPLISNNNALIRYYDTLQQCHQVYEELLDTYNVAPEQARCILPLATYSEVWATFTPSALNRVIALRSDLHAQAEIRELASALAYCKDHTP